MRRRAFVAAVAAGLAMTSLVGCGSDESDPEAPGISQAPDPDENEPDENEPDENEDGGGENEPDENEPEENEGGDDGA